MSLYDAERIEKAPFFKVGPLRQGRGKRTPYVIGFDSEAENSIPFLLQFSLPNTTEDETILVPLQNEPMAAFKAFMRFVATHCTNAHYDYIIYGWNLSYEWTQLFHDTSEDFRALGTIIQPVILDKKDGKTAEWEWEIFNDKRIFATIRNVRRKYVVRFLDGMMFYVTGLDRAAKILDIGEKRHDIDRGHITASMVDDENFRLYAKRDAYLTRLIGENIVRSHEHYDVTQCISAPHFAAKVFRKQFLHTEIPRPSLDLEQVGLWSYHGGKNGFYLDRPMRLQNIWQYDITSAYPEAMRQLPDIEKGTWSRTDKYTPGIHAIYQCTLAYTSCKWRGVLNHDGTWPESGLLTDICLTSYELDAMLEHGEVTIYSIFGWEFTGPSGGPLVEYVDEFFHMKQVSTGAAREIAKLFLNSLYGKFFQKQPKGEVGYIDPETGDVIERNATGDYEWQAGGLYHPPIASLITGYVRGKIHRLEHKYNALMTSTDGFFATRPPDPADIGKDLGKLTAMQGELSIWRERLYVFSPKENCSCTFASTCSECGENQHDPSCKAAPKYALHGWWTCLHRLQQVPLSPEKFDYIAGHVVGLRESVRKFKTPEFPDGAVFPPGSFLRTLRSIDLGSKKPLDTS